MRAWGCKMKRCSTYRTAKAKMSSGAVIRAKLLQKPFPSKTTLNNGKKWPLLKFLWCSHSEEYTVNVQRWSQSRLKKYIFIQLCWESPLKLRSAGSNVGCENVSLQTQTACLTCGVLSHDQKGRTKGGLSTTPQSYSELDSPLYNPTSQSSMTCLLSPQGSSKFHQHWHKKSLNTFFIIFHNSSFMVIISSQES